MNQKLRVLVFSAFALIISALPCSSLDRTRFRELNKKGREVAKKQDWPALREILVEIGKEMQGVTPTYALRMASVETHLGNKASALEWMDRYAGMGLAYDVASDDDLKPVLADAGWKKVAAQMEHNKAPVMHADLVCSLPIADLMPEDITFDKTSASFIVSSIEHHSLYRVALPNGSNPPKGGDCGLQEMPLEAQAKRWPTMAVSFDRARKLVWMTSSALPDFSGFAKEDDGKSALLAIDPQDGRVVRRLDLESGGPAVLGDMLVSADGTVYVSDSLGGGVYRIPGSLDKTHLDNAKLEKIADGLFSPQTPVLAADGKRLFVPEYSLDIAVIDLASGKVTELPHPEKVVVTGLDGMYLVGDALIGIQNGTDPARIMRYRLNRNQTEIESAEVIEQSTPRLGEPTHAVEVDGWVYVSANVGWNKIDDRGKLKDGASFTPPVLLRFPAKDKRSQH